jgi:hypothetical protein
MIMMTRLDRKTNLLSNIKTTSRREKKEEKARKLPRFETSYWKK